MLGVAAQRIAWPIRKPRNNADGAIAPKPEGTGLSGRSALSRRSPVGPATGVASLRASHPGKPPPRPRGAYSEVPNSIGRGYFPIHSQLSDDATHFARQEWFLDHGTAALGNKLSQSGRQRIAGHEA